MKAQTATKTIVALSVLASAQAALAHPGHGAGFAAGAAHPMTGLDHILAMVAVGLCAAHFGGRTLWLLPGTFLALMVAGAAFGTGATPTPIVDQAVAGSVLVLGLLVTTGKKAGLLPTFALVAAFALFHGYAHGSEMHSGLSANAYAVGFILTTAALHMLGIGFGLTFRRMPDFIRQLSGLAIGACGIVLLCLSL
jgi:urease accessory protein